MAPLPLAILAGVIGGGLFATLMGGVPGGPLLAYFAPLPLILAGLTLGTGAAAVAGTTATVVVGLVAGGLALAIFLLSLGAPSVFVVRQALLRREVAGVAEWFPPGRILAQLAAYGSGALVVAALSATDHPEGLRGTIDASLAALGAELGAIAPARESMIDTLRGWAGLLPALTVVSWMLMLVLNTVLAQTIAGRQGRALRPSPALADLTVPRWCLGPVIAGAALSLLDQGTLSLLGQSLLIVFLVPFFFAGLAVVHLALGRRANRGALLAAFYLGLALFAWPLALAVVGLGLIDAWADLRRRLR
jgi:uncharacterized protein YybS (DUF2232 family)